MVPFLLKSTIAMAVLFGIYHLFLEKEKMHRFNRFYLLGALMFSLALPFVNIPVYVEAATPVAKQEVEAVSDMRQVAYMPPPGANTVVPKTVTPKTSTIIIDKVDYLPYMLWGVYMLVALLLSIRFAANISRFYTLVSKNKRIKLDKATVVLLEDCPLPYTFLSYVFVSKDAYEGKAMEAELLTHELTHVSQCHTLDILFAEMLKTLLWFNPLVYFYKRAIQLNHEFLADQSTVQQHENIINYQQLLLDKATPYTTYALASSINFSVTKKRFIMMTKTTTKTRAVLLRLAVVPVAAGLIYLLSTETVLYAKTFQNGNEVVATALEVESPESVVTLATETKDATAAGAVQQKTLADTLSGDARRDEYYKGVKIIIEDAPKGISINQPYEKVTLEHRRYYLGDVPAKKKASLMPEVDYNSFIKNKEANIFINEKKATHDEFLKYKREDFATYAVRSAMDGSHQVSTTIFLFTQPFFNKKMKHLNDHYPNKEYAVRITDKPVDTTAEELKHMNATDASGKRGYDRDAEAQITKNTAATYEYVDEVVADTKNSFAKFRGEDTDFKTYLEKNLRIPEKYKDLKIYIMYSVNTDGTISDVKPFSPDNKLDDETVKTIEKVFLASPRWIPAQKNGRAEKTNTMMTLGEK